MNSPESNDGPGPNTTVLPEAVVAPALAPVAAPERYSSLDVIRGVALFGVLVANLLLSFRISEYDYYVRFHSDSGFFSRAVDYLKEIFISGKAVALFTLLFGVGMAVQVDRARASGRRAVLFLARRLFVLLCFGFTHYLLLWDGDVLVLYAWCGLLLLVFIKAGPKVLLSAGLVLLSVDAIPFSNSSASWSATDLSETIESYTAWYTRASYLDLVKMRWDMLLYTIWLHLRNTLSTAGLMLLGMAAWRCGLVRQPQQWSRGLRRVIIVGGLVGFSATAGWVGSRMGLVSLGRYSSLCMLLAHVPLALAYGAAMLLYFTRSPGGRWRRLLAAGGRMALTNYLMQSLIFTCLFYGYGLGLFGKVSPAHAVVLGVFVYTWQLRFSRKWLRRHRFGPMEWLWRRLTYGRRAMQKASEEDASTNRC